ncbi:hypothetical protein CB1_000422011 [Camelus ferus]|nr:hypothetical protein CB1_000422011 [Camelus ferus]
MHRFEREDVDDIKVHTPYEVSIRQRFIGKPDIAYRLISAKMPEVIPVLEVQFSKKIELLEDAWMFGSTATASPAEKGYSVWLAGLCGTWRVQLSMALGASVGGRVCGHVPRSQLPPEHKEDSGHPLMDLAGISPRTCPLVPPPLGLLLGFPPWDVCSRIGPKSVFSHPTSSTKDRPG